MGWANCGEDSNGRPIGYAHEAVCDFDGCQEVIDRGLGYACGGMHGEDEYNCEGYFCGNHMVGYIEGVRGSTCEACETAFAEVSRNDSKTTENGPVLTQSRSIPGD